MTTVERPLRRIVPPDRVVVHATDLGGVAVLKHGDLYLLTDPFGDVHRDSRGLGLYHRDTRILSCSVLRSTGPGRRSCVATSTRTSGARSS